MRIVMMGTGTFAEPIFEALLNSRHQVAGLVTQPDRIGGEERGSTRQTGRGMKPIAQAHGLPVLQPERINMPEGIGGLQSLQPELLVVAAYGQILAPTVLAVPPRGGINVHASLLPKYRGAAPVAWAIYHGETRTGITIIQMTPRLDAGDMLAQEAIDILPQETAGELEERLAQLGASLALSVIENLGAGTARALVQDQTQVSKAPKLTKEHGVIDWTRPAMAVCNQVRAMQPWPTAFTFFHRAGKAPHRIIVVKAQLGSGPEGEALPGSVVVDDYRPGQLLVAAGHGELVEITDLQPAGKRRMAAADFLRGNPLQKGDRLGPETA
jgi:methionyl-tRNA formyltransferase